MESYGKILLVAMPAFLLLVLFEKWYGVLKGKETVRTFDMIASLSSGVTNVTKDVLGLSIAVISYGWMVEHWALTKVPDGPLTYIIAFFALDFAGYWIHRIAHEYNVFWNNHIVHHSSEEYNLACALRQSISSIVKIFVIFLLPAALLGVPAKVIAIVAPLHLFAQFWYHTQHIGKMGFLEKIIVTPSHHRVHHAINKEYLDKNYAQIFIFWDKLFGTFKAEDPNVPAVYGITRAVQTWNPIKINFMHLWLLIKDAWRTKSWSSKLKIWFMPTGWRPADVEAQYPVAKIEDVYHFEKYDTNETKGLVLWSYIQLVALLLFISYLFGNIAQIGNPNMFVYGLFVFAFVYAHTELMDRSGEALIAEVVKTAIGVAVLYYQKDWFGANALFSGASIAVTLYFIVSLGATFYFHYIERPSLSTSSPSMS